MKKILIALAVMLAQKSFAQVDMSLFKKDQVWLFAGKKYGDCQGIVLAKDKKLYEYNTKGKHKAVVDYTSLFYGDYRLDSKKQLFYFARSGYVWRITKATNTELILTRSDKPFTKDFEDWDNSEIYPTTFKFTRKKVTLVTLPIMEDGGGDGDVWLKEKIDFQ